MAEAKPEEVRQELKVRFRRLIQAYAVPAREELPQVLRSEIGTHDRPADPELLTLG